MGEGQEVTGGFFVAGCDAAVVFKTIDEAFNEVSPAVFPFVVASSNTTNFERRNKRFGFAMTNQLKERVRIVGLVGDHGDGAKLSEQLGRAHGVVFLAGPETKVERPPASIAS